MRVLTAHLTRVSDLEPDRPPGLVLINSPTVGDQIYEHQTPPAFREPVLANLRNRRTAFIHHIHVDKVETVGQRQRDPATISRVGMNDGVRDDLGNQQRHIFDSRMIVTESSPDVLTRLTG